MFGIITPISNYYNPAANVYHHANSWRNRGQSSSLSLIVAVPLERQDWSNVLSHFQFPVSVICFQEELWIRTAATQTFHMEIRVCRFAYRAE